jgi:hypothetical protein
MMTSLPGHLAVDRVWGLEKFPIWGLDENKIPVSDPDRSI